MKKSIKILIVLTILCCMLVVGLTACSDPADNGGSNSGNESGDVGINEIQEFKTIMSAVLDKFAKKPTAQIASAAEASGESLDVIDEICEYMNGVEGKQEAQGEEKEILDSVAVTNFVAMLAFGEVLSEVSGSDKIYGVPMTLNFGENTVPSVGYAIVQSKGTHRIAYMYGSDEKIGEMVYMYDVDYRGENDFSAKMIALSLKSLDAEPKADENWFSYYFYGDTDSRACYMTGAKTSDYTDGQVAYKNKNNSSVYTTSDVGVTNTCFSKVKAQYSDIDVELIRTLKQSSKYNITHEQYMKTAGELSKEYGIE